MSPLPQKKKLYSFSLSLRCARQVLFFLPLVMGLSCGHFQGPEYDKPEYSGGGDYAPQSEFSTPEEVYSSDDVLKTSPQSIERGPFRLIWPARSMSINRGFSSAGRRPHLGLDVGGRRGDAVYAAHDGTIVYAGSKFRGYGRMIILEYNGTWATLYGHLNRFRVKTGQEVKTGQVIGEMGRTGRASGVHLHFELIKNKQPVDPVPYLKNQNLSASY